MSAGESSTEYGGDVASSSGSGVDGRRAASGCSCLPLCFWKSRSRGTAAGQERRQRRRFKLRLSWFSWPWLRKSRGGGINEQQDAGGMNKKKAEKRRRRRRLLLLLLTASKQAKKALAPVSSAGSLIAKVTSFGGAAKEQNQLSKPRRRTAVDGAAPAATSCIREMAPGASVSLPRPATAGGGAWRPPSLPQLPNRGGTDLWTAVTTLGVIVFFGRVTAVIFLCSCLYGARRFGDARAGDIAGGNTSSLRLGDDDLLAAELWTEEYKKKVIMDGLLDRAAGRKRPSFRFCK